MKKQRILFATVCIERNRWTPQRVPTIRVSQWGPRAIACGFDGLELWAPHADAEDTEERILLTQGKAGPIIILNAYDSFDITPHARAGREKTIALIRQLGVEGVKVNLGADPARLNDYLREMEGFLSRMPARPNGLPVRVLCECHPGTVVDSPKTARAMLDIIKDPRLWIIIHPFSETEESLRQWFDSCGEWIVHAHVQSRESLLRDRAEWVMKRLRYLRTLGFQGDYSMEFVKGTGVPDEAPETQFQRAVWDFEVLSQGLTLYQMQRE
jgi:sugar phosphate isomerase/epimerase